jgi:hypothetical protein
VAAVVALAVMAMMATALALALSDIAGCRRYVVGFWRNERS